MNLFEVTVPYAAKYLANLDRWIDKTQEFAKAKKFDANDLLVARLAPDQFPLLRQVQTVCDGAKFICSRPSGKEAPVHPDTEKTWDELRTRIRGVREYVDTFKAPDFDGAVDRKITFPWMPGKYINGHDFVLQFAIPNLHFHYTTTYAILRHNGVELGKSDYLQPVPFKDV